MTMNAQTATPVGDVPYLDIADPAFAMESEEVRRARERSWYARTNYGIAVLRYHEVAKLLKSPKLNQGSARWPDHNGVHSGRFYDWWVKNLLVLEGEEHHRIRRLINPAFSPKTARSYEGRFQSLADELAADMATRTASDFVHDFAEPYATRVLCILLDIPQEEWPWIAQVGARIGLALGIHIAEDIDDIDRAVDELYEYVDHLIEERREHPGDDTVSHLISVTAQGDALSDEELRNAVVLMIFGGMDTTRNQLGLAMQSFIRQPDQWELLAEHPELAANAVEEVIRTNPTTRWVTREANQDFEFQGLEIPAGTTVHLFTQTSGQDPEMYPDPQMDVTERHPPHFGFGGGKHHCLGNHVARQDIAVALPALARRITDVRQAMGDEWLPDSGNYGPVTLPISYRVRD